MEKISIEGGKPLFGKVEISGSKNSSLSILASCLLTDKKVSISGIPKLMTKATRYPKWSKRSCIPRLMAKALGITNDQNHQYTPL